MDSTYREQLEATRAGAERLEEVRRERNEAESKLAELSDAVRRERDRTGRARREDRQPARD